MAEYVLLVSINKNILPYLVLVLLASLIGEVFLPDPVLKDLSIEYQEDALARKAK